MIPKEKVEEVKDRTSIVSVISEYVPLKQRGRNFVGLCPFHSEKTPSFSVSEEKKIYYCFGCNATGNVIGFVMEKDGLDFPEAVRMLAKRSGVVITEEKVGVKKEGDAISNALKAAEEYFVKSLALGVGAQAREYLKRRGFGGDVIAGFRLGFAPDAWEGLTGSLKSLNIPLEAAEKAGLVIKKERGHYDRFRGRLIFPITDLRGRTIGFGGRVIGPGEPKYLNSPETAFFKKGETLYGFFQAKQAIMKEGYAIVVEGYFDALAMHKSGFKNTVATMGTALTAGHLRSLKGYATSVYTLFDSDAAGVNAAIRSLGLFLDEGFFCRAITLDSGKDPDEFLGVKGADGMKRAIAEAEPLMEFFLKRAMKGVGIKTPEGKAKYLDAVMPYLAKVKNVAERGHYAAFAASILAIPPALIYDELGRNAGSGGMPAARRVAVNHAQSHLEETVILRVILKHPEYFDERVEAAFEAFNDPGLKEAGAAAAGFLKDGGAINVSALLDGLIDPAVKARIAALILNDPDGFLEDPKRMLEDSLKRVLNRGKLKEHTEARIKRLEFAGRGDVADAVYPKDRFKKRAT